MFEKSSWIWTDSQKPGQILKFSVPFEYRGKNAVLNVCAETDHIVYLNGKRVYFRSFPSYPDTKYYCSVDISENCKCGENLLDIVVRYEGRDTFCHLDNGAGVIFEVVCDGDIAVYSNSAVKCFQDGNYIQGVTRIITSQLGNAVDMTSGDDIPLNCIETERSRNFKPVPVKSCELLPLVSATEIKPGIFDLGEETAGYLSLEAECDAETELTVCYGEHLADGSVRDIIGNRNFSLRFHCKKGVNRFEQFFTRIGARYLEVKGDCRIKSIGLYPYLYPLTVKPHRFEGIDKDIYDVSVRTLRLCMHEHYEDCPWREQALYVLDSRNQMKCGYDAFEESDFQKQMLLFMLEGQEEDGLMSITFPSRTKIAIPSFSLIYPISVYEYVTATGDKSILPSVLPAIKKIFDCFIKNVDGTGLIRNIGGGRWNFYEWTKENAERPENSHDLILNCLFVYSYYHYELLCQMVGSHSEFKINVISQAILYSLYNSEKHLFANSLEEKNVFTRLGNSLAVIIGFGDETTVRKMLGCVGMTEETLSMKCFFYDALLETSKSYKDFILDDIRRIYGYMLGQGATSFWETIKGEKDFDGAGSLCHGWSAMAVHYLRKFDSAD